MRLIAGPQTTQNSDNSRSDLSIITMVPCSSNSFFLLQKKHVIPEVRNIACEFGRGRENEMMRGHMQSPVKGQEGPFVMYLHAGKGEKCENYGPTVKQTQIGFATPPKFSVEVQNVCPMCPVINVHLKCGNFSQALVNSRRLIVVHYDDCVANGGRPLAPLQKLTFTYSHQKYNMSPASWNFQCE